MRMDEKFFFIFWLRVIHFIFTQTLSRCSRKEMEMCTGDAYDNQHSNYSNQHNDYVNQHNDYVNQRNDYVNII